MLEKGILSNVSEGYEVLQLLYSLRIRDPEYPEADSERIPRQIPLQDDKIDACT